VFTETFDARPKAIVSGDRNVHSGTGRDDDSDNGERAFSDIHFDTGVRYLIQFAGGLAGRLVGPQPYFLHLLV
jgi:hypothetical protein